MVAPPVKTVTFADDVVGSGDGSTFSRNAAPPPPSLWGSGQFFAYPLDGGNLQPSFGLPASAQLPDPLVQPPDHLVQLQRFACRHMPFGGGNITCPQKAFGIPNQQCNGTSGQASTSGFGAPQIAIGSNSSSSSWGMSALPGQVSATSNLSGSSSIVGCGHAVVDNLKVGSGKSPYSPTTEIDGKCRSSPEKVTSISAMYVNSKSHEELRLEDYQHQRSQGNSFLAAENSTNKFNRSFPFGATHFPISESTSRSSFGNSTIASQSSISASTSCPASGSSTVAPLSSISASTSSSAFGSSTVAPLSSVSASTSTLASGHSTNMSNQKWTFPEVSCSSDIQAAFRAILRKQPHPNGINIRDADDSRVPKGLEVIAESLGFNPWSLGKDNADKLESPAVGGILSCVEVDKDDDIIALAEFAVEQHKALQKDDRTTFSKVVVACLEPFQGGRYHIVLDTVFSGPGFLHPKRHYAVVLRKCTQRANCLTVLEKWL